MTASSFLSRLLAAVALVGAVALVPAGSAAAAERHVVLDPALPSDTSGKTEVLEFFAYSCIHCKALEPLLESWKAKLPDTAVVRPVPVGFNASMKPLQQLYYSLETMGRLDLHGKVFIAIHDQRQRLFEKDAILDWVAQQGIDRSKFQAVYDSFGVQAKVQRADQLVKAYAVDSTPTLAIGGRYVTSPALAGGYQESLDEAGRLLEMARKP